MAVAATPEESKEIAKTLRDVFVQTPSMVGVFNHAMEWFSKLNEEQKKTVIRKVFFSGKRHYVDGPISMGTVIAEFYEEASKMFADLKKAN